MEFNKKGISHIVLITKVDLVKKEEVDKVIKEFKAKFNTFLDILPFSIKKPELKDDLLEVIRKYLPEHPFYFEEDLLTPEFSEDIYKEFIKEAIFDLTKNEIPYESEVEILKVERSENLIKVYAVIIVSRESQKGIVIGKGGKLIKEIGKRARKLIEALEEKKVYLDLTVKVRKNWHTRENLIKELV